MKNPFSGLFRARDKPQDSVSAAPVFYFGTSGSGKSVTVQSAIQLSTVYACVRVISETVASLPLGVYEATKEGNETATTHPLFRLLHDEPNSEMTSFVFREVMLAHLLLYGNSYSQIIRSGKNQVVGLYPLLPDHMDVDRDSKGNLTYTYTTSDGKTVVIKPKDREGFQRMVEDAMDGKIDLIVTKSVSRFARNTVDSLSTIRKLKEHGTEVYFEKENIWTFDSKGELLLTIMSSLAQEESRSISENVRWGQRKKAADGKYTLPFDHFLGYDKGPDGTPVVNKEQAAIVRRIYGLYLQGYSVLKIAKTLTADGIPSPAGKKKWNDQTVHSILTNETYMGDKILQKTYSLDFLHKERIRNKGEVPMYHVEQDHEAIIPPETFQRVQDEMERRRGGPHTGETIFSGKIFCGDCGKFYGPKVWHSNDKYLKVIWQCAHKYHGQRTCTTPHVYEDGIKEAFIQVCNKLGDGRDEVIGNLREVQAIIGGTETLGQQKSFYSANGIITPSFCKI